MMTIDWQVMAQYDDDRLTSDKHNMMKIDWQVKAQYDYDRLTSDRQYDDDRLTSESAIWWR